jgi:hypothetical protein
LRAQRQVSIRKWAEFKTRAPVEISTPGDGGRHVKQEPLVEEPPVPGAGGDPYRSRHACTELDVRPALYDAFIFLLAFLDQKRFVDFFERLGFLPDSDGDRAETDRATGIILRHEAQHAFVHFVETGGIDLEQFERGGGDGLRDPALGLL